MLFIVVWGWEWKEERCILSSTSSELRAHWEKKWSPMQSLFQFLPPCYSRKFKAYKCSGYLFSWMRFSFFAGSKAVPLFTSQTSPARMSVTLPSVNLEDCSQSLSISTVLGGTESSGTDTFWKGSRSQLNICATGFEVIFLKHKTMSHTIWGFEHILKNNF